MPQTPTGWALWPTERSQYWGAGGTGGRGQPWLHGLAGGSGSWPWEGAVLQCIMCVVMSHSIQWYHMELHGIILISSGITWYHLVSHGMTGMCYIHGVT